MDYSKELFVTRRYLSSTTRHRYVLYGAFYDAYTDDNLTYYVAEEDRKSLMERIHFYEEIISKKPEGYPLFKEKGQDFSSLLLRQVLGLPYECMIKEIDGKKVDLSIDEILGRIIFETGLFHGYGNVQTVDQQLLRTNHFCIVGLMNYFIENGIYLLNPEILLSLSPRYPIYIDEKRFSERFPLIDAEQLFMDFCENYLEVDSKQYLTQFAKVNQFTLQDRINLAFFEETKENGQKTSLGKSLQSYFLDVLELLSNEFFLKHYNKVNFFDCSILYHELGIVNTQSNYVYLGTRYSAYSPVNDFNEDFLLDVEREDLTFAYRQVKKFFVRNPKLNYMPMTFVKALGLPYPAYLKVRFFDFEFGDADAFLTVLGMNRLHRNTSYILPVCRDDGSFYVSGNVETSIPYLLRDLAKDGVFLSDIFGFCEFTFDSFLLIYDKLPSYLEEVAEGKAETYQGLYDKMTNDVYTYLKTIINIEQIKTYFLRDNKDGTFVGIKKFFAYMKDGYTSYQAFNLTEEFKHMDYKMIMCLIYSTFVLKLQLLYSQHYYMMLNAHDLMQELALGHRETLMGRNEYNHCLVGRNFVAYYDPKTECYALDSKDLNYIMSLMEFYHTRIENQHKFPYEYMLRGYEIIRNYSHSLKFFDANFFSGLPFESKHNLMKESVKDNLKQFRFVDGISVFDDATFKEKVKNDLSFSTILIKRHLFEKGFYLSSLYSATPIYSREKADPCYSLYFRPDVLMTIQHHAFDYSLAETLEDDFPTQKEYQKTIIDYVLGKKKSDSRSEKSIIHEMQTSLMKYINSAFRDAAFDELFTKNGVSDRRSFIGYLKLHENDTYYLAPGVNFVCYSETGNPDDYFFSSKDKKALEHAVDSVMTYCNIALMDTVEYPALTQLGIPLVVIPKMYRCLKEYQKKNYNAQLGRWFKFRDIDEPDLSYLKSADYHWLRRVSFLDVYNSIPIRNALAREGFFIFGEREILGNKRKTVPSYLDDGVPNLEEIAFMHCSLSENLTGKTKEIMMPSELAYSFAVDDFIEELTKEEQLDSDLLFYVKEALKYGYYKNPYFIVDAINDLQKQSIAAYRYELNSVFSEFRFNEFLDYVDFEDVIDYIALFLVYLEQKLIQSKTNEFVKKKSVK